MANPLYSHDNPNSIGPHAEGTNYGFQVEPNGPLQNMALIDTIAGGAPHDRRDTEQAFTGGLGAIYGEPGLGGHAEGTETQVAPVGGS